MKVILMTDIPRLGQAGQQVEVADGFARNYLLPRKLAVAATAGVLRSLEQIKAQGRKREGRLRQEAEEISARLAQATLTVERQAGDQDRLFGSVTNQDLRQALGQQGIVVDKRRILLEEPIKQLGTYTVPVRLHPEVTAELKVEVIRASA